MSSSTVTRSATSCLLGGSKISLDLLSSLSDFIPIPYVNLAVDAAVQIIKIAEKVKSNREDLDDLAEQVYAIMLVVATSLKGEQERNITGPLKRNLERLSDIVERLRRLKDDSSPSRLRSLAKSVLKSDSNAKIIKDCMGKVGWAIQTFHVESRIHDTIKLTQISDKMEQVDSRTESTHIRLEKMAEAVLGRNAVLSLPSTVIPPKPAVFYGRNEIVDEIVGRILSDTTSSSRLAILGAGGLGKTSVALAVAGHPDVVKRFGNRRGWARCDEATSPALLLELLARVFRVTTSSPDRLQDIVSTLQLDPNPHFLLLDNFETPWDIQGRQSEIEFILCTIAALLHVTILITMRGSLPAATSVHWSQPVLRPLNVLSSDAARQLYTKIHPEASQDYSLTALLTALDHMPLAVTLMAKVGSYGESPTALLKRWKSEGIDLVDDPGGDRHASMNMSITLSLKSNLIKHAPDALLLLSVLALLPAGVRTTSLPDLVPSIKNPLRARASLLRASLAYLTPDQQSLCVLSPIRSFMILYHPLSPENLRAVHTFYFGLLASHNCEWANNPRFHENVDALSKEDLNIEAVLQGALEGEGSAAAVDAAVHFASFQLQKYPRPNILDAAVRVARTLGNRGVLASALQKLASIKTEQNEHGEARGLFEEARREFHRLGEPGDARAAQCLEGIGIIEKETGEYDQALITLWDAHEEFQRLGDRYQAADCLQELGRVEKNAGNYHEACAFLQRARSEFRMVGGTADRDAAWCLTEIGDVHALEMQPEASVDAYKGALHEFRRLGDRGESAKCLRLLGEILQDQDQHDEARVTLQEARRELQGIGYLAQSARCLWSIGEIDRAQGLHNRARTTFLAAREECQGCSEGYVAAMCLKSLGEMAKERKEYDEASVSLLGARREFQIIHRLINAALCLQSLGDIERMRGQHAEARQTLEKAREELQLVCRLSDAAYCLRSMGEMAVEQRRYDEAHRSLGDARREFQRAKDSIPAAVCLYRLGQIERMRERYTEARETFQEAYREFQEANLLGFAYVCLQSLREMEPTHAQDAKANGA